MTRRDSVLVFGATGGTGRHFVAQALEQGHHVRALVRTPAKIAVAGDALDLRRGSITEPIDLDGLIEGVDAVVLMLGDRDAQRNAKINTAFIERLVPAMRRRNVTRLLYQAGGLSRPPGRQLGPVLWTIRHTVARSYIGQHEDNEAVIAYLSAEARDIGWIVHRAAIGSDGPSKGLLHRSDTTFSVATFRDCAAYSLRLMTDASAIHSISFSQYARPYDQRERRGSVFRNSGCSAENVFSTTSSRI